MSHIQINQYLNIGFHYMRVPFMATVWRQQWRACQASRCWPDSHTSEPAIIRGHCKFYPGFTWAEVFAECVHYSDLPELNSSQDETQSVLSQVLQTIFMPCWIWLMFVYSTQRFPVPAMVQKWPHHSTASLNSDASQQLTDAIDCE